jgi:hypothetical protein
MEVKKESLLLKLTVGMKQMALCMNLMVVFFMVDQNVIELTRAEFNPLKNETMNETYKKSLSIHTQSLSIHTEIQFISYTEIGHPEIITENFDSVDKYFGLINCSILPPNNLYIPVLPFKQHGKLMFPLCRTCCEYKITKCNHSEIEQSTG